jgi:hypothetical protein
MEKKEKLFFEFLRKFRQKGTPYRYCNVSKTDSKIFLLKIYVFSQYIGP